MSFEQKIFWVVAILSVVSCRTMSPKSLKTLDNELKAAPRISDYQIGPTWGKRPVSVLTLSNESSVVQKTAKSSAKIAFAGGGATAFVLGLKNDEILMATNHHVMPTDARCQEVSLAFEFLEVWNVRCKRVVVTDESLDITVFAVTGVNPADIQKLLSVATSFSAASPKKGTSLMTLGFGLAGNPSGLDMMLDQDPECKVFSADGDVRLMSDPDLKNPNPYKTWMFATGCDVSHGDSGSPFVDVKTGELLGILSTAKFPKNPSTQTSAYLDQIFAESSDDIWRELTYVVPSSKIVEKLKDILP